MRANYELRFWARHSLSQPAHQHWPSQYDFEKMPRGSDLLRRRIEWGIAGRLYQNNLVIESDFEARFYAIARVERIGQAQHSGELQRGSTVRRIEKLQALLARTRQGSAMISSDDRNELQLLCAPAERRGQVANHSEGIFVVRLAALGFPNIVQQSCYLQYGAGILLGILHQ